MMSSSTLLLLALLVAREPALLDLDERIDSVGVVLAPRGWHPTLRGSDLLDATDEIVRAVSRLRLRSSDQAGLDKAALQRCGHERRFLCWMRIVARATDMSRVRHPITFVMIVHPRRGEPAMTVVVVDSKPFFVLRDTAIPDEIETKLRQNAMTVGPILMTGQTWQQKLNVGLRRRVQRYLSARGHAPEHGALALSSPCAECELRVDGQAIGSVGRSPLRLTGLRSGVRSVSLFRSGEPFESERVRITAGDTTAVSFERRFAPSDPLGPTLLWGGTAALATGAAMFAAGLAVERSRPVLVCLEPPCDSRFIEPGLGAASAAFAGAGATWLATWLLRAEGDESTGWWGIGLGIAIGVGAGLAASQL